MIVGLTSALVGGSCGLVLGVSSAYFGGRIDLILQRIFDVLMLFR
jgi:peptide/nickel transport system permease protein